MFISRISYKISMLHNFIFAYEISMNITYNKFIVHSFAISI
jgi:hypothetical protein